MSNEELQALTTLVPGSRSQVRQRKRWIDTRKEDLHQRGSGIQQAAECVEERTVHTAQSSTTYG